MKTFIFALIGLLGVTLGAPYAEARDKDRDRDDRKHYKHYRHSDNRHYRHHRHYRSYPRSYYYSRSSYPRYRYYTYPRYYSYPRYYGSYDDSYYGSRYYYRRPSISFSFGL